MKSAHRIVSAVRLAALRAAAIVLFTGAVAFGQSAPPVFQWTTIHGRASFGTEDGLVAGARFNDPTGLAFDQAGNLYVADTNNHTIRKISPAGIVSTVAGSPGQPGSADGIGPAARFHSPQGVAADAAGNLFVADTGNCTIRKISPAGLVSTLAGQAGQSGTADGIAASALFSYPQAIAVDGVGNVYVGGSGIRRISAGTVQTIFTSGSVTLADGSSVTITTYGPVLAVDAKRQIFFSGFVQSTQSPAGLFKLDAAGAVSAVLYPGDWYHYPGGHLSQLATDPAGNLVAVVDYTGLEGGEFQVCRITAEGTVNSGFGVIHDGTGADCPAGGLAASPTGEVFYSRADNVIVKIAADGSQAILAGTPASPMFLSSLAVDSTSNVWAGGVEEQAMYGRPLSAVILQKLSPDGTVSRPGGSYLTFEVYPQMPGKVAVDSLDNLYFIGSLFWPPHAVMQIAPTGAVSSSRLSRWDYTFGGFAADSAGDLIVPDGYNHVVWKRTPDDRWTVLVGKEGLPGMDDGIGDIARFDALGAITADRSGNFYVVDQQEVTGTPARCVIRRISPAGAVLTVSGNLRKKSGLVGLADEYPRGLAIDSHGAFYLTYGFDSTVWRLSAQGEATVIGGAALQEGSVDGLGSAARFVWPTAIAVDAHDNLYVADGVTIRKGQLAGLPLIISQPQSQTVPPGSSVQFSVTFGGVPAPACQWYCNGAAIGGATAPSLSIANVQAANAGQYTVTVSNALGTVTSSAAVLTVHTAVAASSSGDGGGSGAIGAGFVGLLVALATARSVAWRS